MRSRVSLGVLALASTLGGLILAGCTTEEGDPEASGATGSGTGSGSGGSAGSAGSSGGSAGSAGNVGGTSGGSAGSAGSASGGSAGSSGGTSGGSAGSAGSAGSGGTGGTIPGLETCPMPPAGSSEAAVTALNAVNTIRLAMGIECMELISELSLAAQNHCDYYAQNLNDGECHEGGHGEVEGCPGFTGDSPGTRIDVAGYDGQGWSEVMAFENDPEQAVAMWINSVWHRTPLTSPWWRHMGYGGAEDCDVIDLGPGDSDSDDVTALYPYSGQTDVPTEFDGSNEGPEPPEPTTGWPSGPPIHVYAKDVTVVSHRIDVDGMDAPMEHVWIDDDDQYIFYSNEPLAPATTYRVRVSLMRGGTPLDFDWKFTTEN